MAWITSKGRIIPDSNPPHKGRESPKCRRTVLPKTRRHSDSPISSSVLRLPGSFQRVRQRIRCGAVDTRPSLLIRPDACIAWAGEVNSTDGLEEALRRWTRTESPFEPRISQTSRATRPTRAGSGNNRKSAASAVFCCDDIGLLAAFTPVISNTATAANNPRTPAVEMAKPSAATITAAPAGFGALLPRDFAGAALLDRFTRSALRAGIILCPAPVGIGS